MIRIHYFSHPSTYENESSHSCTFSMIRSFADLERLFSLNSSSFATIALRFINLNGASVPSGKTGRLRGTGLFVRSEEHTSELQSRFDLVCRLLLEKQKI